MKAKQAVLLALAFIAGAALFHSKGSLQAETGNTPVYLTYPSGIIVIYPATKLVYGCGAASLDGAPKWGCIKLGEHP